LSGDTKNVIVTNHFNGVADMDSFKKSSGQIQRQFSRSMAVANSREGRVRVQPRNMILTCYMSNDFREGLDAFLNKRKPKWTGT